MRSPSSSVPSPPRALQNSVARRRALPSHPSQCARKPVICSQRSVRTRAVVDSPPTSLERGRQEGTLWSFWARYHHGLASPYRAFDGRATQAGLGWAGCSRRLAPSFRCRERRPSRRAAGALFRQRLQLLLETDTRIGFFSISFQSGTPSCQNPSAGIERLLETDP